MECWVLKGKASLFRTSISSFLVVRLGTLLAPGVGGPALTGCVCWRQSTTTSRPEPTVDTAWLDSLVCVATLWYGLVANVSWSPHRASSYLIQVLPHQPELWLKLNWDEIHTPLSTECPRLFPGESGIVETFAKVEKSGEEIIVLVVPPVWRPWPTELQVKFLLGWDITEQAWRKNSVLNRISKLWFIMLSYQWMFSWSSYSMLRREDPSKAWREPFPRK